MSQVNQEAGERIRDIAVVVAFLGEGCRDLVVVVGVRGLRLRQRSSCLVRYKKKQERPHTGHKRHATRHLSVGCLS